MNGGGAVTGKGRGESEEIPCKPYRVLHNQNQERDADRCSEEEAKDLNPGLWQSWRTAWRSKAFMKKY